MLGSAVLRFFSQSDGYAVFGSVRSSRARDMLPADLRGRIICGVNVDNADSLLELFGRTQPDIVINCVGLIKQLAEGGDPLAAIPINSLLPHRLVRLCRTVGARLIHISTDCVFSGTKGLYREDDVADASDLYGRSKLLGEVDDVHAVTLRTSIIGPELNSAHGLVSWFLAQRSAVKGFTRAIFSGLPTVELARVMRDFVIPIADLRGLYHVSAAPIAKYDLLVLVANTYGISINIEADSALVIDRSLDSSRFSQMTGYYSPAWPVLVRAMYEFG
jgi:dTDP-4-dehydrorhamnose reductase